MNKQFSMNQIEEHLLTSPKSQPGDLNNLSAISSLKKTTTKKIKERKSKNFFNRSKMQNPVEINISQFTHQMSLISSSPMDTPTEYLKVNKLMRITNEISPVQSKRKNSNNRLVFTPQQRFIMIFNLATIVVIYMYFCQIPISIAFQNHRKEADTQLIFQYINIPALLIFLLGAIIKSRTSYFQYGILITDTKLIAINYFKKFLIIDLFSIGSIIVYEISQVFHKGPITYRFIILLFYLKIGELISKQKYLINQYDLNRRVKASLKLFLLLTKIFMIVNIVACGFFYLSDNLCRQGGIYQKRQCCWIKFVEFDGDAISKTQWNIQYAYSIYWASTTMISIGYGDITPQNPYQISYTIFIQFGSCLIYAYSINQIWQIIQQLNSKKDQIQHRISVMNTYMRDKQIGPQLKSKIKAYLLHFYYTKNIRQKDLQNDIIQQLTPSLKTELFYEAYGFIFRGHNFFKNFSSQVLQISSQKIIESGYFQQQMIFGAQQGNQSNMLFYIQQGQVQNYIQLKKKKVPIRKIYFDETIGLNQFITQLNYKSNLIANKYSVVYKLKFIDWKGCLLTLDQDFQKFYSIRQAIVFDKNYEELDYYCQFCKEKTHLTQDCFQKQIDHITAKYLKRYKIKAQRCPYQRSNVKNSHILSRISIIKNNTSAFQSSIFRISDNLHKNKLRKNSVDLFAHKKQNSNQNIRFKKFINKNYKNHHDIVKQIKSKIQKTQGQDFDDLYSQNSQMLSTQNMIDKVQNYDYYFPKFNAEEQAKKQKQNHLKRFRMTRIF